MVMTIKGTSEETAAFFAALRKQGAATPVTRGAVLQAAREVEESPDFRIKNSFVSTIRIYGEVRKIWVEFQSS